MENKLHERILELYLSGESYRSIADSIGLSKSTVARALAGVERGDTGFIHVSASHPSEAIRTGASATPTEPSVTATAIRTPSKIFEAVLILAGLVLIAIVFMPILHFKRRK